jgi:cytochrome c oxidase subunit 3
MRFGFVGFVIFSWWRDVQRESVLQGSHNTYVQAGLKLGFTLFILREVILFFTFFWSFFHLSLSPSITIGLIWPAWGVVAINPFQVPLLNTVVLLRSGATVTLAHYQLIKNTQLTWEIWFTIALGGYFTFLQGWEYVHCSFTMSDSVFGRLFFLATGFHGIHVLIGTVFLLIMQLRALNHYVPRSNHVGFEMRLYYWHFVDVVWLFLYTFIYCWRY